MERLKKISIYILLFVAFLGATRNLYGPGYFNMHDDLQVMRLFEMEKCFADGQIPCRWAPDMAWGYGQPMFNFYSAFPYYLGYLIRQLTPISIMGTVLLLFNISLVASGFGMYLLGKKLWGNVAGIVASLLYVYAPYHLLDVYIRGALSESFSLALLPFLWLSILSYIKLPNYKNFTFNSVIIALLLITHNLSTIMYLPFTALWTVYWLIKVKNIRTFFGLSLSTFLGLGMAAFFVLPVAFENKLIQTEFLTVDYLNYEAHFVTLKQLFIQRDWGHGPSIFGPNDEISFQIGWPHWFLLFLFSLVVLINRKHKLILNFIILTFGLSALFLLSAFLTHPRSIFIWKAIPEMAIIQFPWRFLGPAMFLVSLVAASTFYFKFRLRKFIAIIIMILTIVFNFNYAIPWNRSYEIRDDEKLSGVALDLQRKSAILDYLPKTAKIAPKDEAFNTPIIIEGEGRTENFNTTSSTFSFDLEVFSDNSTVEIPVMYFPNWTVVSGGRVVPNKISGDYGLISIQMPQGKHIVHGRFLDTPVRKIGNLISISSVMILLAGFVYFFNKNNA